jgi:hypothetical protein
MPTIFRDVIEVNGVTFNDPLLMPANVGLWGLDDLAGWDDTAEIDLQTSPIGGAIDGEEIAPDSPRRARHFQAGGYVLAADRVTAETTKDILWRDAFPTGVEFDLTRNEAIPKFVTCRVSGRKQFFPVGSDMYRWLVPLIAGDPLKYGVNTLSDATGAAGQSTGGRTYPRHYPLSYGTSGAGEGNAMTLVNVGTVASAKLTLTIVGPLNNGSWRVSNETNGGSLSFDVDVASTDTLVIDFKDGTALLNGYPIGASIIGDFWKLSTGENIIKLFADYNASVSITALGYSAWE